MGVPVVQPNKPRGDEQVPRDAARRAGIRGSAWWWPTATSTQARGARRPAARDDQRPREPPAQLRGAAPINWAILEGEAETGVSIMQMEAGLDSGPVLRRVATPIGPDETAGALTERLARLGAEALGSVVADLAASRATPSRRTAGQLRAQGRPSPRPDRLDRASHAHLPTGSGPSTRRPEPGPIEATSKCFAPRVLHQAGGALAP
ncbi:MAG: formyltransferase family protein [Gemmatimonadales bacterium]